MQDGLRDINTHIEAAMFSYHVAHDLERGRKHLTADVRRSITRVQQGMFTVKHRFERVVERVRALEREQRDRRDEEELLEAVEDVESPRKKLKVELSLIKCHVCEMSEKGPKMLLKAPDTEGNTGGGGFTYLKNYKT